MEASFASTDNNSAPRFGVIARSAIDGTFTTGSVGFLISTQKSGSHRADNFSATAQSP